MRLWVGVLLLVSGLLMPACKGDTTDGLADSGSEVADAGNQRTDVGSKLADAGNQLDAGNQGSDAGSEPVDAGDETTDAEGGGSLDAAVDGAKAGDGFVSTFGPLCPSGEVKGSYTIENSTDVASVERCTSITGDLIIDGQGIESVSLPVLESIGADLQASGNSSLESLELPALTRVGSAVGLDQSPALANLSLPLLRTVGDGMSLDGCPALTELSLPSLTSVDGLYIGGFDLLLLRIDLPVLVTGSVQVVAPMLSALDLPMLANGGVHVDAPVTTLNLPSLTSAAAVTLAYTNLTSVTLPLLTEISNELHIFQNSTLSEVNLPMLASIGTRLIVSAHTSLTALNVPALKTIGGDAEFKRNQVPADDAAPTTLTFPALETVKRLSVSDNGGLAIVSLPVLGTTKALVVMNNDDLTDLSAPMLTRVEDLLDIRRNPTLMRLDLPALSFAPTFRASGNPALPSCQVTAIEAQLSQNPDPDAGVCP